MGENPGVIKICAKTETKSHTNFAFLSARYSMSTCSHIIYAIGFRKEVHMLDTVWSDLEELNDDGVKSPQQ